nr:MAG TPA: hypothetical protein [Caudoviricetes sp.]
MRRPRTGRSTRRRSRDSRGYSGGERRGATRGS